VALVRVRIAGMDNVSEPSRLLRVKATSDIGRR
jgi:hypothetical protein